MWVQDKKIVLLKNVEERMTSRVEVMEEMRAEGFSWVRFFFFFFENEAGKEMLN